MGTEKPPEFYDSNTKYMNQAIIERYMPIYEAVANLLPTPDRCPDIVDLGCGVGHFAKLIYDRGYKHYLGIDFSLGMISKASNQVPEWCFLQADLIDKNTIETYKRFKLFVAIETFEHIVYDCLVIESLRGGSEIIFTLPSFDAKSHVRHFKTIEEIKYRYKHLLDYEVADYLPWKDGKHKVFIIKAKRK